jgi:CBS domain containing-hemolysin-like protein
MSVILTLLALAAAAGFSLVFSSINQALRHFSRTTLAEVLGRRNADHWFEPLIDHVDDLIFVSAVMRLAGNLLIWLVLFVAFDLPGRGPMVRYGMPLLLGGPILLAASVAVPTLLVRHAAELLLAVFAPVLSALRITLRPLLAIIAALDRAISRIVGPSEKPSEKEIEEEIIAAIEEGEKEGVVDEDERQFIESVIELRDSTAEQIMTPLPDVVAIEVGATLDQIKELLERAGHSRIPVYEGSLDHVVGVLYSRDLLRHMLHPRESFAVRATMRPALFVPESHPTRDLLKQLRAQNVHIAIVLDEYGSTTGVVTMEDIVEELIGEISDEHESITQAAVKRIDEMRFEVDGRLPLEQLNRLTGLKVPEDSGYETVGGFIAMMIGRVPETGAVLEHDGARYTVLDAQRQRINRVGIDLSHVIAAKSASTQSPATQPGTSASVGHHQSSV